MKSQMKILGITLLINLIVIQCHIDVQSIKKDGVQAVNLPQAPYAEWAHHHWVWLNGHQQTQQNLIELVNNYLKYNIPVGALNIDSGWSTGYNNFIVDTKKFPNLGELVQTMNEKDIHVLLWATSAVNKDSSNYQQAYDKGYFLNKGKSIQWWHGVGGLLDYSNPEALEWWHKQMKPILDLGIDGWQCDGTDPYVYELIRGQGKKGHISRSQYSHMYYGDFFNYTREVRGQKGLIMSRPVDNIVPNNPFRHLFLTYSPKYVMLSGWVGDQDHSFRGMRDALTNMFHASWLKFANFGSDIGGYRGNSDGKIKNVFIRWAQMGAFVPLMQNGGGGEHQPWNYDTETVNIYRKFSVIHHELIPYLLLTGSQAIENQKSSIQPMANRQFFLTLHAPKRYDYMLGNDFYISPVVEDVTSMKVRIPKKDFWVDYWNSTVYYPGGSKLNISLTLDKIPVFKRAGSMITLRVESDDSLYGNQYHSGFVTVLVCYPQVQTLVKTNLREEIGGGAQYSYFYDKSNNTLTLTGSQFYSAPIFLLEGVNTNSNTIFEDLIFNMRYQIYTSRAEFDNNLHGVFIEPYNKRAFIKTPKSITGSAVQLSQFTLVLSENN